MSYTERAQEALDGLGWADTSDPMEVTRATMTLARLVVDMARALDALVPESREARCICADPLPLGQLPEPCPFHGYVGEPETHDIEAP